MKYCAWSHNLCCSQEVMSLRDFVHQEETGMRAYSEKLAEYFASSCAPVREEDLVEAVKALGLPRYIFSGMQQVCATFLQLS